VGKNPVVKKKEKKFASRKEKMSHKEKENRVKMAVRKIRKQKKHRGLMKFLHQSTSHGS
jgi:hypothetical protein